MWNILENTPGTRGGSGFRERTQTIKIRKMPENIFFCKNHCAFIDIHAHYACTYMLAYDPICDNLEIKNNTPGTEGGPGDRDRTLAMKKE